MHMLYISAVRLDLPYILYYTFPHSYEGYSIQDLEFNDYHLSTHSRIIFVKRQYIVDASVQQKWGYDSNFAWHAQFAPLFCDCFKVRLRSEYSSLINYCTSICKRGKQTEDIHRRSLKSGKDKRKCIKMCER